MKRRLSIIIAVLTLVAPLTFGQGFNVVDSNMRPAQAVQQVLVGAGINAFNVTYNGSAADAQQTQQTVKHVKTTNSTFPIKDAIFMTTTNAPLVNDSDLSQISVTGGAPTNGAIIEFDFVPTGDTLAFNYIFASTEYTIYTCSQYNDAFGFFISGPGINGPYANNAINIATIPGSNTPIAVNTLNGGSATGFGISSTCASANPNWQSDSQYFTTSYNPLFGTLPSGNNFNGASVMLTANSDLICGDTFHIKLAIANVKDQALNSGVFLQAHSFSSNTVNINISANLNISTGISGLDTMLIEGCTTGDVVFTRPAGEADDTLAIHFTDTLGTAHSGEDYPPLTAGDSVMFLPGEDTIIITMAPYQDNVEEGPESIIISASIITQCGDTIFTKGEIWVDDEPHSEVNSLDTTVLCYSDSVPLWANTTHGFPPYTYTWTTLSNDTVDQSPPNNIGDTTFLPTSVENGDTTYIVTSTDYCGFQYSDTSVITLNQTLAIDTMFKQDASCGEMDGLVSGMASGTTGTPKYIWTNTIVDTIPGDSINASTWQNVSGGWYYFIVTDDVCQVMDSIKVDQQGAPSASFDATPSQGVSPLNVTFTNTSSPADTYHWDFGNGQTATVNDLSSQHSTYINKGVYTVTLTVTKGGCTDEATKQVEVLLPLHYHEPNVFTPNDDGVNDFFTFNTEHVVKMHIVILNRWGNLVFESDNKNFKWNGKRKNTGAKCDDGVYFYKFTIQGYGNQKVEGEGFVHLVRNK